MKLLLALSALSILFAAPAIACGPDTLHATGPKAAVPSSTYCWNENLEASGTKNAQSIYRRRSIIQNLAFMSSTQQRNRSYYFWVNEGVTKGYQKNYAGAALAFSEARRTCNKTSC